MSWPSSPAARLKFWWYDVVVSRWIQVMARKTLNEPQCFVAFIAHANTGHSLVGQLLNAHPHIVISHELNALALVQGGIRRRPLFARIIARSRYFKSIGHRWYKYDYTVPGAWQGRRKRLVAIGDKKGGRTAQLLLANANLLDALTATVGIPLRLIQVHRNPFDSIATNAIKRHPDRHDDVSHLGQCVKNYLRVLPVIDEMRRRYPVFSLGLEELIARPAATLEALAAFIGVASPPQWVAACQSRLFESAKQTRRDVTWTADLKEVVGAAIRQYDWLNGYTVDSP
jgi:hypothetical protein